MTYNCGAVQHQLMLTEAAGPRKTVTPGVHEAVQDCIAHKRHALLPR